MRFSSTIFVLASLVASAFSSTPDDIKADIAAVSTQVTAVDNAVNAFQGGLTEGLVCPFPDFLVN